MEIIRDAVSLKKLQDLVKTMYGEHGELVKAVIDVERGVMVIGGELHADEEALLLENGSKQENLWGINIYPAKPRGQWIEFDSMINLRPSQNNRTRSVDDSNIRDQITRVVEKLVQP